MLFELSKSIQILERTPAVLYALLDGLADEWIFNNEGENTWSPFDVVGHLIVCEKTNFMKRMEIILSGSPDKLFASIDRYAQLEMNKGKKIQGLLREFAEERKINIQKIMDFNLSEKDFQKEGVHPNIGKVTLGELLATWVAHDLTHISQITRVMAKQYKNEIGPFIEFLSKLK